MNIAALSAFEQRQFGTMVYLGDMRGFVSGQKYLAFATILQENGKITKGGLDSTPLIDV